MLFKIEYIHFYVYCKEEQYEGFPSHKLVEADSADMHRSIEYDHCRPSLLQSSSPPRPALLPLTPSNVLSVHKHKLNLLLMIALLTRRGSIHSRRPATTTGQISWRERGQPEMGTQWERIYSGLNNGELCTWILYLIYREQSGWFKMKLRKVILIFNQVWSVDLGLDAGWPRKVI